MPPSTCPRRAEFFSAGANGTYKHALVLVRPPKGTAIDKNSSKVRRRED
jgi:hypothetical protein